MTDRQDLSSGISGGNVHGKLEPMTNGTVMQFKVEKEKLWIERITRTQ